MFENISTEELQRELELRKEHKKKSPIQLFYKNFDPLIVMCQKYIDDLACHKMYDCKDTPIKIFESAITCIFGSDVWKWINKAK